MKSNTSEKFQAYSQPEMQNYLDKIYKNQSLISALEALFLWSIQVGYITQSKLNDNLKYKYPDPETGVTFRTQINIARSNYTPTPLSGKNIPKLHCPICFENIGLPGKENLRAFEFLLSEKPFFAQLTPFPLYPKHFVLISKEKTPMIMNQESIQDMLNFLALAPSYTVLSNSDVEWAGASVLNHHHYQAIENLSLPITEAKIIPEFSKKFPSSVSIKNSENLKNPETLELKPEVQIGLLDFPIASCLIKSTSPKDLIFYGQQIIQNWRSPDPLNTCNLALHSLKNTNPDKNITTYFLYIIFRNPDYRTPESLRQIKSEGVGIIEVCGEGIYPVPKDPQISDQIKNQGLDIIKGIIAGNNPILRDHFSLFFNQLTRAINPIKI